MLQANTVATRLARAAAKAAVAKVPTDKDEVLAMSPDWEAVAQVRRRQALHELS